MLRGKKEKREDRGGREGGRKERKEGGGEMGKAGRSILGGEDSLSVDSPGPFAYRWNAKDEPGAPGCLPGAPGRVSGAKSEPEEGPFDGANS